MATPLGSCASGQGGPDGSAGSPAESMEMAVTQSTDCKNRKPPPMETLNPAALPRGLGFVRDSWRPDLESGHGHSYMAMRSSVSSSSRLRFSQLSEATTSIDVYEDSRDDEDDQQSQELLQHQKYQLTLQPRINIHQGQNQRQPLAGSLKSLAGSDQDVGLDLAASRNYYPEESPPSGSKAKQEFELQLQQQQQQQQPRNLGPRYLTNPLAERTWPCGLTNFHFILFFGVAGFTVFWTGLLLRIYLPHNFFT